MKTRDAQLRVEEMGRVAPVFIVGAERSGTSILYRSIQQHPSFRPTNAPSPTRTSFTESDVLLDPARVLTSDSNAFRYLLSDKRAFRSLLSSAARIQVAGGCPFSDPELTRLQTNPATQGEWRDRGFVELVRLFYYPARDARGCRRIVDKIPRGVQRTGEIFLTFPDAFVLFLHRNPVMVLGSMRRRSAVEADLGIRPIFARLTKNIAAFSVYYASVLDSALEFAAGYPARFRLMAYENFVQTSETVLGSFFDWIGEEWSNDLLPKDETESEHWEIDPLLFDRIHEQRGNGHPLVDADEAEILFLVLDTYMNALGYAQGSPDDGQNARQATSRLGVDDR